MTRVTPFCLRCGEMDPDVRMAVVDLEAEAKRDGSSIREVEVVTEIPHRHVTERVSRVVPERYGAEWRCRDRDACDRRYAEQQAEMAAAEPMSPPSAPPADVATEAVPWL